MIWRSRKCQIKWEIVSNFCGLFWISELYFDFPFHWVCKFYKNETNFWNLVTFKKKLVKKKWGFYCDRYKMKGWRTQNLIPDEPLEPICDALHNVEESCVAMIKVTKFQKIFSFTHKWERKLSRIVWCALPLFWPRFYIMVLYSDRLKKTEKNHQKYQMDLK